ncbi:MAG: acyclic terpene utilization AtuA family protein [Pseudomonadota bacterium]
MGKKADGVRIGCGAGFAGDRFDAAVPIVREFSADPGADYLMFECLGERTLALAQAARARDPDRGYSPFLDRYLAPILGDVLEAGIRVVSNLGAANPKAGARRVQALAREQGLRPPAVAIVSGDDLRNGFPDADLRSRPRLDGAHLFDRPIVAANVYLGATPLRDALATGAPIVLVGRTTDSALALGPLMHEFAWDADDLDRLAAGTICGHLLECGAQVTGAYFADPGFKDVPDLAHVGFPIAEIASDGRFVLSKPADTGGVIDRATVTEQVLYEMHDPAAYLVPDVTADITGMVLEDLGGDRVAVSGVRGHAPPADLKATLCVENGWMAEAEMSYGGPNATARARLAGEIVTTRLREAGLSERIAVDLIGEHSVMQGTGAPAEAMTSIVRLRLAMHAEAPDTARALIEELQALYCSGPAGGGGFRSQLSPQVATGSILVPRERVEAGVRVEVIEP